MQHFQVASALIKQDGKILICQRGRYDEVPLLWEFPGGKLKPDETLEECIVRELKEELDLETKVLRIFAESDYSFQDRRVHFTYFDVEIIFGTMKLNVHEEALWVPYECLGEYEFFQAQIDVVKLLLEQTPAGPFK